MIIRYLSPCLQKAQSLRHILRYGPITVTFCVYCFVFCFYHQFIRKSQSKINRFDAAGRQDFMGGGRERLREHSTFKHRGSCLETEPRPGEAAVLEQEVTRRHSVT